MYIAVVCELVYILAVDLQLLPSRRVLGPSIRAARLGCLYAPGADRVEEAVLPLPWMRSGIGCWSTVLFLEIVPLSD
jgi:hypothetical protein